MSFDRLAPHYRWMEFVLAGPKLQRCRTQFLEQVSTAGRVLLVGEGNGRFLLECRRRLPSARITCLDASPRMLAQAELRLKRHGLNSDGVQFVAADALRWKPPIQGFDLLATHFFFDCFPPAQLAEVVSTLSQAAAPRAVWLLSDFGIPPRGWRRVRARLIHWSMYCFFRCAVGLPARKLTPADPFLQEQAFTLRHRLESEWGLLHADLWVRN